MGKEKSISLRQALRDHGTEKIRCPHCGRKSNGMPFLLDALDAIRAAVTSGKAVLIRGMGYLAPSTFQGGPDCPDRYFRLTTRSYQSMEFLPTRMFVLEQNGLANGQSKPKAKEQSNEKHD